MQPDQNSEIQKPFATPLPKEERIRLLDAIRGIALLGILLMNSMAQSQAHQFYDNMNLSQPLTGPNFYAWAFEMGIAEGTMRGLFSILFGAGTFLFLSRLIAKEGIKAVDIYYRRMFWLLIFGLVNAYIFLWPGDILYPYALCGILLFPFRNWSPKKLFWAVVFLLAIGLYRENSRLYSAKHTINKGMVAEALSKQKKKLTPEQNEELKKWEGLKENISATGMMKKAEEETRKVKGKSYVELMEFFRDINMKIQSVFFYNNWWDILSLFVLGMALFKIGFISGSKPTWVYGVIAVLGIAIGLTINYFVLRTVYTSRFDGIAIVQKLPFNIYQIRRVCQTLGYLSLLVLLYKVIPFKKFMHVFAPVGQMAFTNYLMQSIITSTVFYGFGLYAALQRYQVYYIVVAIWIFQTIFSNIWLRYFYFGPFEWLWRSLTYQKKQPMLKRAPIPAPPIAEAHLAI